MLKAGRLFVLALALSLLVGCDMASDTPTTVTQSPSAPTVSATGGTVLYPIYPGAQMIATIEQPGQLSYQLRPYVSDGALNVEFESTDDHAGTLFLESDRRIVLGDLVFHGINVYPAIGWVIELPDTWTVEYHLTLSEGASAVLYRDTPDMEYRADIAVLSDNGNGPRTESTFSDVKGCKTTTVLGPVMHDIAPGSSVALFAGEHRYAEGLTLNVDDTGRVQLVFSSAWNIREPGC